MASMLRFCRSCHKQHDKTVANRGGKRANIAAIASIGKGEFGTLLSKFGSYAPSNRTFIGTLQNQALACHDTTDDVI